MSVHPGLRSTLMMTLILKFLIVIFVAPYAQAQTGSTMFELENLVNVFNEMKSPVWVSKCDMSVEEHKYRTNGVSPYCDR